MNIKIQFRRCVSLVCAFVLLSGAGWLRADERAPFSVYAVDPQLKSLMYVCGAEVEPTTVLKYEGEDGQLTFVWYRSVDGQWKEDQSQTEPVTHGMLLSVCCPPKAAIPAEGVTKAEAPKKESGARDKYLVRLADDKTKLELSFETEAPPAELASVATASWDGKTWSEDGGKGMPILAVAAGKDSVSAVSPSEVLKQPPTNPYGLVLAVKREGASEAKKTS